MRKNMEDKQVDMLIYVMGFVGLIVLLGGVFNLYTFKYGLFAAIIIWFISGAAKRYYS